MGSKIQVALLKMHVSNQFLLISNVRTNFLISFFALSNVFESFITSGALFHSLAASL